MAAGTLNGVEVTSGCPEGDSCTSPSSLFPPSAVRAAPFIFDKSIPPAFLNEVIPKPLGGRGGLQESNPLSSIKVDPFGNSKAVAKGETAVAAVVTRPNRLTRPEGETSLR